MVKSVRHEQGGSGAVNTVRGVHRVGGGVGQPFVDAIGGEIRLAQHHVGRLVVAGGNPVINEDAVVAAVSDEELDPVIINFNAYIQAGSARRSAVIVSVREEGVPDDRGGVLAVIKSGQKTSEAGEKDKG